MNIDYKLHLTRLGLGALIAAFFVSTLWLIPFTAYIWIAVFILAAIYTIGAAIYELYNND